MAEGHVDEIRDLIRLTRGLCVSQDLESIHRFASNTLDVLTRSAEIRKHIGLESLHLWTFCSRQRSSSAIVVGHNGHLLIDGFQLDKLFSLLQAFTNSPNNSGLALLLPAILSEAFCNADQITLADRMMDLSIAAERKFQGTNLVFGDDKNVHFKQVVQSVFLMGHEIGHFFLSRQSLREQIEREKVIQSRLENAIRYLSSNHLSAPADWQLLGSDKRFRDELFCDTVGVEMVEVSLALHPTPEPAANAMAFEVIYFTILGLDLLRILALAPVAEKNILTGLPQRMTGREFIRGVCLNLLAQNRFFATRAQVEAMQERLQQAYLGEYGLEHVIRIAEQSLSSQSAGEPVTSPSDRARLESMFHWEPDLTALKSTQIY